MRRRRRRRKEEGRGKGGKKRKTALAGVLFAPSSRRLFARARSAGVALESFQSNHEGALIDRVQAAGTAGVGAIIINPGGLTHTSVSLRDALVGVALPFIEVHLTNVHAREPFRRHSYFSDAAIGSVVGLGSRSYELALDYLLNR